MLKFRLAKGDSGDSRERKGWRRRAIKAPCPECGQAYLGLVCACRTVKRRVTLRCICGAIATLVYQDELGEWPLCRKCMQEVDDEDEPLLEPETAMAAPQPRPRKRPGQPDEAQGGTAVEGLSLREEQIAAMYAVPLRVIAGWLGISEASVKAHFRAILRKLGIKSRREIPAAMEGRFETRSTRRRHKEHKDCKD